MIYISPAYRRGFFQQDLFMIKHIHIIVVPIIVSLLITSGSLLCHSCDDSHDDSYRPNYKHLEKIAQKLPGYQQKKRDLKKRFANKNAQNNEDDKQDNANKDQEELKNFIMYAQDLEFFAITQQQQHSDLIDKYKESLQENTQLTSQVWQTLCYLEHFKKDNETLSEQVDNYRNQNNRMYMERVRALFESKKAKGITKMSLVLAEATWPHIKNPVHPEAAATKHWLISNGHFYVKEITEASSLSDANKKRVLSTANSIEKGSWGNVAQIYSCAGASYMFKTVNPVPAWEFEGYYFAIDQMHQSSLGQAVGNYTKFNALPEFAQRYSKSALAFGIGFARRSLTQKINEQLNLDIYWKGIDVQ